MIPPSLVQPPIALSSISSLLKIVASVYTAMGKKNFYAVKVGRSTGVFNSWSECEAQVKKYPGAVYKGFAEHSDASDFVKNGSYGSHSHSGGGGSGRSYSCGGAGRSYSGGSGSYSGGGSRSYGSGGDEMPSYTSIARERYSGNFTSNNRRYHQSSSNWSSSSNETGKTRPVVYSDGCCLNNGFSGARAGIGVYWGEGSSQNISERLEGRQTNQRAELVSACRAIESAADQGLSSIELKTDSVYTIKVANEWIHKWEKNGWLTSKSGEVKNKQDIQRLDDACKRVDVKWTHVRGHIGIAGNEAADSLAKAGSKK